MAQCAADKKYCTVDLVCSVNVKNDQKAISSINVEFEQCNNTTPAKIYLSNNNTLECCQMYIDLVKAHSNSTFCITCYMLYLNSSANNTEVQLMVIGISCTLAVLFLISTCIILLCYCWIRKKRTLMTPPRCNSK